MLVSVPLWVGSNLEMEEDKNLSESKIQIEFVSKWSNLDGQKVEMKHTWNLEFLKFVFVVKKILQCQRLSW